MNKMDFKKLFHYLLGKSSLWYSQDASFINLLWNASPAVLFLCCGHWMLIVFSYCAQSYEDVSCCSSFQPRRAFLWKDLHLPARALTLTRDCVWSPSFATWVHEAWMSTLRIGSPRRFEETFMYIWCLVDDERWCDLNYKFYLKYMWSISADY